MKKTPISVLCALAVLCSPFAAFGQELRFGGRAFFDPDELGPTLLLVPAFEVFSASSVSTTVAAQLTEVVEATLASRGDAARFSTEHRIAANQTSGEWALRVGRYRFGQVSEVPLNFYRERLVACTRNLPTTQGRAMLLHIQQGTGADIADWEPAVLQAVAAMKEALEEHGCTRPLSTLPITPEVHRVLEALAVGLLTESFDDTVFFPSAVPTLSEAFHDLFYGGNDGLYLLEMRDSMAAFLSSSFERGLLRAEDSTSINRFRAGLGFFLEIDAPVAFRLQYLLSCGEDDLFEPPMPFQRCVDTGRLRPVVAQVGGERYLMVDSLIVDKP